MHASVFVCASSYPASLRVMFVPCHFVKSFSLYVIPLKVAEPTDDSK